MFIRAMHPNIVNFYLVRTEDKDSGQEETSEIAHWS